MRWLSRAGIALALGVASCLCVSTFTTAATGHPAGFTSINRYLGVECEGGGALRLAYLLDFAETPSYAEMDRLDADHDGAVSPEEQRGYLDRRLPPLVKRWDVEVDGVRVDPRVTTSRLEVLDGERGLPTLRIYAEVSVDPASGRPMDQDVRVHVVDRAFSDRSGWREMAAADTPGWTATSGPKEEPGAALSYAAGAPAPRVDEGWFTFRRRDAEAPAVASPEKHVPHVPVDPRLAALSRALRDASGSRSFSLMAFVLAVVLGAVHALSPGHGKALAAAYLTGGRARPSQALVFGTTVAVAHTIVVFAVGSLAVAIERTVGSEPLMRGLEIAADLTVVALGATQLTRHWRAFTASGADHAHAPSERGDGDVRSVVALGASAGLSPCPSALALWLSAMAVHRPGLGLALVVAFSLGVASTLAATGLLVVLARGLLDRAARLAPVTRLLPVVSSACVLAIGIALCASSL